MFVLIWTRRTVRRTATAKHATSEIAKKSARQFVWSCMFFVIISGTFGIAVSGIIWYSSDFVRTFGAIWFGAATCVAIFIVRRDAKPVTCIRPRQAPRG